MTDSLDMATVREGAGTVWSGWKDLPLAEKLWVLMMSTIPMLCFAGAVLVWWYGAMAVAAIAEASWITPWTARVIVLAGIVLVIGGVALDFHVTMKHRDGR